jgi:hypothetical protein
MVCFCHKVDSNCEGEQNQNFNFQLYSSPDEDRPTKSIFDRLSSLPATCKDKESTDKSPASNKLAYVATTSSGAFSVVSCAY